MQKILVTGAIGQVGSELLYSLRAKFGTENVIASDIRKPETGEFDPFETLDVLDKRGLENIIKKHNIEVIYHLAAILSANGEKNPAMCWDINMNGLHNVLEVAKQMNLKQIICPSSIAVFGPETPRNNTPQETVLLPKTMYGITKVSGELLCEYYSDKFGVDIRGLRYPGLISSKTLPGGGTTDYAVEIFYEAIRNKKYECFLSEDTIMPMMYMPDAIRGTIALADAELKSLKHHANFNFSGMSFSCKEIADEIKKHIPEFEITYAPDFRQEIADTWPQSIDDSSSREEWGWEPEYDLAKMVKDMLDKLTQKLK
ncbi:MAG: nucleoside-diphosphate-sugar epimerase [Lentimonas sp.]|jgi:nucleoside-diphosphate-sugar epimerase